MPRSLSLTLVAATLVSLASAPSTARAEAGDDLPHPALYVGLFGGYNVVVGDDWDLNEQADAGLSPGSSPLFGLRLGVQVARFLAIELGAALIPWSGLDELGEDAEGMAVVYRGDLLIHPLAGRWSPYAVVGAGLYQGASGDFGTDADYEIHWGLGLRVLAVDWLAVRAEVRHNLTDSFGDGLASLVELTLGVDLFVWRAASARSSDIDSDGVADGDDLCPTVAGSSRARGCPDADGDGVPDHLDKCVDRVGPRSNAGCPDSDGDGIADDLDRCPDEVGPSTNDGCPVPVDTDGDGIDDADDLCPEEVGPVDTFGCPDRDGDGILDRDDRCPDVAGVVSEQGCLPTVVFERFSGAIRGIEFAPKSARIQRKSFKILDEVAQLLAEYPSLSLEISGHTDSQGDPQKNMALSQARADSVRDYFIAKGIAADRLTAIGHGATKPVDSNNSEKGRANNRRIEFDITSEE